VRAGSGDPLTAAELTGGLDSRLVLAARVHAGTGRRSWTIGNPDSAEVFRGELVGLRRLRCVQQSRELNFWSRGAGIELDRLAQQRLGLGSIAQTRGRGTERRTELALEYRIPITRLHQV
jgi:hypothetical protein